MSEDVKTRILRAAKKLFALQGFDGTSVRQICEEAGANVALVSYHFGGKEKLLGALYAQVFPTPEENALMDKIEDPVVRLKTLIAAYLTVMHDNEEIGRIVQLENLLQSERVEEMRQYTLPYWSRWRRTLEEGRAAGRFQFESIDTAMLQTMGAVIYPLTHTFVDPMLSGDEHSIDEQIRQRTEFILRALGAAPNDLEGFVRMENRRVITEK